MGPVRYRCVRSINCIIALSSAKGPPLFAGIGRGGGEINIHVMLVFSLRRPLTHAETYLFWIELAYHEELIIFSCAACIAMQYDI